MGLEEFGKDELDILCIECYYNEICTLPGHNKVLDTENCIAFLHIDCKDCLDVDYEEEEE